MSGVLCYGEALIDFLQFQSQEQDGLTIYDYRQFPGGAPANAAVALAKLGGRAQFAGQVGSDQFGEFLIHSLAHYGVDTQFTLKHETAPTPLAFVHLDASGDRSFTFMRKDSADLLLTPEQVSEAWFASNRLVHLCSNTLTESGAAATTQTVLEQAKALNLQVCFDVNLRANLWKGQHIDIALVNQVVKQADIVKFAKEEFELLSQDNPEQYLADCLAANCKLILITNGGDEIEYVSTQFRGFVTPAKTQVVDTTAGGDGFIGATLYLLSETIQLETLLNSEAHIQSAVAFASCAGAIAVSTQGAFPALPSFTQVSDLFNEQFSGTYDAAFLE